MIHDIDSLPIPLPTLELFGREAPIEIEIGVGKGLFLKTYSQACPHLNLIGIEKSLKWLKVASERLQKIQAQNVRLFSGFAEPFLGKYFKEKSIRGFHIYFPDPWPKRRQKKRRLFQPEFMLLMLRLLEDQGTIQVATDHSDYFTVISKTFEPFSRKGLNIEVGTRGEFSTNFQVKYEKEGRPIYFLKATKDEESFLVFQKELEALAQSNDL